MKEVPICFAQEWEQPSSMCAEHHLLRWMWGSPEKYLHLGTLGYHFPKTFQRQMGLQSEADI